MPGRGFMYDTACNCPYGHVRVFDKYTNMKLIASHGGGYLPFIHGRLDVFFNVETLVKFDLPKKPSEYLEQIYYDAIVYDKGVVGFGD